MKKAVFLVLLYFVCLFAATLPFVFLHLLRGVPGPLSLADPAALGLSVLRSDVLMMAHLI